MRYALGDYHIVRGLKMLHRVCGGDDRGVTILKVHAFELWLLILDDINVAVRTIQCILVARNCSCDSPVVSHEDRSNCIDDIAWVWCCRVEKGPVMLCAILLQGGMASIVDGCDRCEEHYEGTELFLKVAVCFAVRVALAWAQRPVPRACCVIF